QGLRGRPPGPGPVAPGGARQPDGFARRSHRRTHPRRPHRDRRCLWRRGQCADTAGHLMTFDPPGRRSLFGMVAAQRRFIYLVVALLSAAGVWTAFRLASAIYPELTFSRITVVAQGTALGARQILFSVTRP